MYSVFGRPAGILQRDSPIDPNGLGKGFFSLIFRDDLLALLIMLEEIIERMLNPFKDALVPYSKSYRQAKAQFHSFIEQMIEEARKKDPGCTLSFPW